MKLPLALNIQGALVSGQAAHALTLVISRGELIKALDAEGLYGTYRELALDALGAIEREAAAWRSDAHAHVERQLKAAASGSSEVPQSEQGTESPQMDTTCTTNGAAEVIGISARQVRNLIRAGKLPARRHGRDWEVDKAAASALAADRKELT